MADNELNVGDINNVSGELNIAGGDIYKGLTLEEVSVLITRIKSEFTPRPFDGHCPYKGLDVFEEQDADLFFGREKIVADLGGRLKETRALFVLGPSGSGKSSLVRAGLIPELKQGRLKNSERWLYEIMKPGREPLESLAIVFARLKSLEMADYFRAHVNDVSILNLAAESVLSSQEDQRFVLFIDQFEEVFTQISGKEERAAFLKVLTDAIAVENGRVILLFAMRSDFVPNCADYPALNSLLNKQSAFVQIGAMQPKELVSAIAQPALRVGLSIDPRLIQQIIDDMKGEPGTLPLMQFALKDLFNEEQASGGVIALTQDGYIKRGGIHKSLERHADEAFKKLNMHEQELARTIFGSLIEVGQGTPDTGRTALFDELVISGSTTQDIKSIVEKLADARLITTDEQAGKDLVTISHERLIDAWPWLRKLVNENRDVIALQNEIAKDAKEWNDERRDTSYLYTGARLENALEKLKDKKLVLSGTANAFIQASRVRKQRNRMAVVSAVSVIIILLTTAVIIFNYQSRAFAQQARIALARFLVAESAKVQDDKRDVGLLLGIQAYNLQDNFETRGNLISALQCCSDALISFMSGHEDSVWDVDFSPDNTKLASVGIDGTIRIWDTKTRQPIRVVKLDSSAPIYTVMFSPVDSILAVGDGAGLISLYSIETWQRIATLRGHAAGVLSIKFSKDGKWLASGGFDGKVLVWDVANRKLYKSFSGPTSWVWDVAISADNKIVASVGRPGAKGDSTLWLWNLDANASDGKVGVPAGTLVSAAFNDKLGSRMLLTGDSAGNVYVWDINPWQSQHKEPVASKYLKVGPGATGNVWGLAFIPGHDLEFVSGRETGILNRNLIVLNDDISKVTLQRQSLGVTGNNFGVFRIAISPDGKLVAAAGQDGLVSLWKAAEASSVIRHTGSVVALQLLNNESSIAMSLDEHGELYRWDYGQQGPLKQVKLDIGEAIRSAISPDGMKLVTGYEKGIIRLWDGSTGQKLSEFTKHLGDITSLAFSYDGELLASSDDTGKVILWKVENNKLDPISAFVDPKGSAVQVVKFSPDGKTLVAGGCGIPITIPSPDCSKGTIYVLDVKPKLQLRYPPLIGKSGFVWSLAFNPADSAELAVGTRDGTITVWNLPDQQKKLSIKYGKNDISALAFSPTDTLLAVGADVYKVFLYDSRTGQLLGQAFRDHDGSVTSLVFSPDGKTLLSGSIDGTVVIHDMDSADLKFHACRVANRNLTRAEWEQYIGTALPYPTKQEDAACPNLPIEPEPTSTP